MTVIKMPTVFQPATPTDVNVKQVSMEMGDAALTKTSVLGETTTAVLKQRVTTLKGLSPVDVYLVTVEMESLAKE